MFSPQVHRSIFIFGVFSLGFGMMMGTVPTSVPQIILAGNWVSEMDYARKWRMLRTNRLFWILSALYLIHVGGVFYSADLNAALHDIRTKMPIMFLPLLFLSTAPLSAAELKRTFYFFIGGCVTNTLWCLVYSFILHNNEVVRNASRFMSHIRLGLYLNLAIAACLYYGFYVKERAIMLVLFLLPLYFLAAMVMLGLASGLTNFLLLGTVLAVISLFRKRNKFRIAGFGFLILFAALVTWYLGDVAAQQLRVRDVPQNRVQLRSGSGDLLLHTDTTGQKENGYYVLMNVQPQELERAWNREFPADSFQMRKRQNIQRFEVLVRYMASKGLIKDSAGYALLTPTDKTNISKNFTNHLQPGWSFLRQRSYELVNEYDEFVNGRAVNGHSFTMRLYFWKAALHAIALQPYFGYGTGDVQQALDQSYQSTISPLSEEWRLRPHNQFLTVTVALGAVGLLVMLFSLLAPVTVLHKHVFLLYWPFFVLVIVSFLFEDTLETQAGLTFFAFFNALLLCDGWFRKKGTPVDSRGPH